MGTILYGSRRGSCDVIGKSCFAKGGENDITFVALLTTENTGKDLPPTKLTNDRPIGISDCDWRMVCVEYYLQE